MNRRQLRRFDEPQKFDPFISRTRTVRQWLASEGMRAQVGAILRDAADFAGSDNEAFLAYAAWKIRAHIVKKETPSHE